MSERKKLDEKEDKKIVDDWYERAAKMQDAAELGEFVRHLVDDFTHDYGTIVHACAAAALAGAWAVCRSNNGGSITGFQAGIVMWQFVTKWLHEEGKPMRMQRYDRILFPQYDGDKDRLSSETFKWLVEEAKRNLEKSPGAHPEVLKRWQEVAAGKLPAGWMLES